MAEAKDAGSGGLQEYGILGAALGFIGLVVALWAGLKLAGWVAGVPVEGNPFDVFVAFVSGQIPMNPLMIVILIAVVLGFLFIAGVGLWVFCGMRKARKSRVDYSAMRMSASKDYKALLHTSAKATSDRLGVNQVGLAIGKTINGGATLYSGWEDVMIDIWGPRTGKTTSRAVPLVLDAPGAVVATSNKRDLLDVAGPARKALVPEGRVWVFDPQGIAQARQSWYWDPLTFVNNASDARELAQIFTDAARPSDGKQDAFFDTEGPQLLMCLIMAATAAGLSIQDVYLWLTNPNDTTPIEILRSAGEKILAAELTEKANAPDKQRGGVYATAKQGLGWLADTNSARWALPGGGEAFNPDDFARSRDSIFVLSKEGAGSSAPLTTALTVAITRAAERYAEASGGRLPVPMVMVLDEAANVVRWRGLPGMYSHYGSRGIVVDTILQSWAQGAEVWGKEGIEKLWSSANIKVYGGGDSEVDFLDRLRQTVGKYDQRTYSSSYSEGRRTVQNSVRTLDVLDVAELAALPRGRILVMSSGSKPVLASPVPYYQGPHAQLIESVRGSYAW